MELVEGQPPAGPISVEAACHCHQLIDALEYAIEKSVVHRDLKPPTSRSHQRGASRSRLVAGALRRHFPSATRLPLRLTMQAPWRNDHGHAAYMSPEQARGQSTNAPTSELRRRLLNCSRVGTCSVAKHIDTLAAVPRRTRIRSDCRRIRHHDPPAVEALPDRDRKRRLAGHYRRSSGHR